VSTDGGSGRVTGELLKLQKSGQLPVRIKVLQIHYVMSSFFIRLKINLLDSFSLTLFSRVPRLSSFLILTPSLDLLPHHSCHSD
jgi:hypothetical protein